MKKSLLTILFVLVFGVLFSFSVQKTLAATYPPNVTTDFATISSTQFQNNQATLKGTVVNNGGASIDKIKFFWGTSPGSYTLNSGDISYAGAFQYTLTGMTPGTIYYYKAQAHNLAGWSDLAATNERKVFIYEAYGGQKQFTTLTGNNPPQKPTTIGVTWQNCVYQGKSIPTFHWNYSDPDGDQLAAYEIEVDSDFAAPKFNHLVNLILPSPSNVSYALDLSQDDDSDWLTELAWNTTYYWRVRVKDDHDNWSEWSDYNTFTTPLHAYPWPDFTHIPQNPSVGQIVTFTDNSKCYSSPGNTEYNCKDGASIQYEWDFDYVAPNFNGVIFPPGDANTTFSESRNYEVRLKITDNTLSGPDNYCIGAGDGSVGTTLPLPEYKETPPIIWLKNIFLAFLSFLNDNF